MAKTSFTSGPGATEQDRAALLRESAASPEDIEFEMSSRRSQDLAHEAKETGKSLLESQKRAAADSLEGWAHALRRTAEQLQQDDSSVASIARSAADSLAEFSGSLRSRDVTSLMTQAQDFARRRPALFLGGAVAGGFLLARFLKSSGQRGYEESSFGPGREPVTGSAPAASYAETTEPNPVGGIYETR
jgi:hypothetical protein